MYDNNVPYPNFVDISDAEEEEEEEEVYVNDKARWRKYRKLIPVRKYKIDLSQSKHKEQTGYLMLYNSNKVQTTYSQIQSLMPKCNYLTTNTAIKQKSHNNNIVKLCALEESIVNECQLCDFQCYLKSELNVHKKTMHASCYYCKREFASSNLTLRHINNVHSLTSRK